MIFTLKKLKSQLPSLKPKIEKEFKSGVVYQITCPRCQASYVGQTRRHLLHRLKEHSRSTAPVGSHLASCMHELSSDDVKY